MADKTNSYPYIPNSVAETKREMLEKIGVENAEELYEDIPEALLLREELDLPEPFHSEYSLTRHIEQILSQNRTSKEFLNFLGAGCYQHHVPAVCDEINGRSEFLTAYAGEPYDDHGRFQALFEYTSMMGELIEMDVVNVPTYDGFQAAATAIRMASRMTGRTEALIPATISPDLLSKLRNYCEPEISLKKIGYESNTGLMDLDELKRQLSPEIGAVFFENPSYLGFVEINAAEVARLAHEVGAECIVSADPISLGVLSSPASYGADIVCGDIQSLGMHMQFGGGHAGYIGTRDEERYVMEYPSRLFGITQTNVEGEYGFGDVAYERTSFAVREEGKEWVGTAAALWGITAGVYMALMGPRGFAEIGETIMQRSAYAAGQLNGINGVRSPVFQGPHFKEFIVNFDETGVPASEINKGLLSHGIFGGKDLSDEFPGLGNSSLFCVTEIHTKEDIDRLVGALTEVLR